MPRAASLSDMFISYRHGQRVTVWQQSELLAPSMVVINRAEVDCVEAIWSLLLAVGDEAH